MNIEYGLNEVDKVAQKIIEESRYKIVLFEGNLGAGKTTLIKSLVKALGSAEYVSSPTFSILNEYQTANGEPIYHMDLYRLKNEHEAFDLGLDEILENDFWKFIAAHQESREEWKKSTNNT